MEEGKAGPSEIPLLSGALPGVFDPTQPSRLLRTPNSALTFASFNPYIATPQELFGIGNLTLDDDRCRPKRIVIETIPGHGSFWRWVPSARKQEGVDDEGIFPRLIEFCGKMCICSQEQWDFHKLDPLYDCYVKFPPALSVISVKETPTYERVLTPTTDSQSSRSDHPVDEDYDSERMIVDDDNSTPNSSKMRSHPRRKRRKSPRTPHHFEFANEEPDISKDVKSKRRAHVSFQSLRPAEEEENAYFEEDSVNRNTRLYTPKNQKRARTMSPGAKKRVLNAQRSARDNMKKSRWEEEKEARREHREKLFMREVLTDVPQGNAHFNGSDNHMNNIPEEAEMEEPPLNMPTAGNTENSDDPITESRKKMAELNADRDRQRQREKQYRADDDVVRKAKSEEPCREQEKKRKLAEDKRKQEEVARQREESEEAMLLEENKRRRAELMERLDRERGLRHEQWNSGLWSPNRAIERYKSVSAFFDRAKFSKETLPLMFIDIPWPTLKHPYHNKAQDVDWDCVKDFFDCLKQIFRDQEYKDLLKASFQRFHPDRWTSRNLYPAILNEQERNEIDTAVTTVSKAIGALYSESKDA